VQSKTSKEVMFTTGFILHINWKHPLQTPHRNQWRIRLRLAGSDVIPAPLYCGSLDINLHPQRDHCRIKRLVIDQL